MSASVHVRVVDRVLKAMRPFTDQGYPLEGIVIHLAQNLWQGLAAEYMISDLNAVNEASLGGLKAVRDRSLDDDQIRLRYEVIA